MVDLNWETMKSSLKYNFFFGESLTLISKQLLALLQTVIIIISKGEHAYCMVKNKGNLYVIELARLYSEFGLNSLEYSANFGKWTKQAKLIRKTLGNTKLLRNMEILPKTHPVFTKGKELTGFTPEQKQHHVYRFQTVSVKKGSMFAKWLGLHKLKVIIINKPLGNR